MKKVSLLITTIFLFSNSAHAIHHPSPAAIATAKTIYSKKGTVTKPQPTGKKIEEKVSEKESAE